MSIYPYITATIVTQLLIPIIPGWQERLAEGETGKQLFSRITRLIAVPLCNQPMEVWQTMVTRSKEGKRFEHRRFVCKKDDVWARLEIPLETSPQAQQLSPQR